MHRSRIRRGLAAALLTVGGLSPAVPGALATADTEAVARITVTYVFANVATDPIDVVGPTVEETPEDGSGVPASWSCDTTRGNKRVRITCLPLAPAPSGQWICPSVSVRASAFGAPTDTVAATAACGDTAVTCTPQVLARVASECARHADLPAPVPFVCDVNYTGVTASDWTVVCETRYVSSP